MRRHIHAVTAMFAIALAISTPAAAAEIIALNSGSSMRVSSVSWDLPHARFVVEYEAAATASDRRALPEGSRRRSGTTMLARPISVTISTSCSEPMGQR